jgi:hypothetical protein
LTASIENRPYRGCYLAQKGIVGSKGERGEMKKATGSGSLLRAQQLEEGEPYGLVWAMGNPGLKAYSLYIHD